VNNQDQSNYDHRLYFKQEQFIKDKLDSKNKNSRSPSRSSLSKSDVEIMKKMTHHHVEHNKDLVSGLDPKYLSDVTNYWPNTEYSVTLDFKKEFIRHKRVICSLKEFNNYDVQNKWDVSYCKAFCHNGNNNFFG
jgi:hypothetical protein